MALARCRLTIDAGISTKPADGSTVSGTARPPTGPVASKARPVGTPGKAADPSADDRCRPTAPTRRDAPGHPDVSDRHLMGWPANPPRHSLASGTRRRIRSAGRGSPARFVAGRRAAFAVASRSKSSSSRMPKPSSMTRT